MSEALRSEPTLYEADEHLWVEEQVAALRDNRLDRLDRAHLIEFLEDMSRRDKLTVRSRLVVFLMHMLRVEFQPSRLSRSWLNTIVEQQTEIEAELKSAPSLRRYLPALLEEAYPAAVRRAAQETGLAIGRFPPPIPWSFDEIMSFRPARPRQPGR